MSAEAVEEPNPPRLFDNRDYRWNLLAAIILSMATLASAWCGFQASSWGSVYSSQSRASNTYRLEAGRQSDIADRQMSNDVLVFSNWLEAEISGKEQLADEISLRFTDHFRPAFEDWSALPVGQDGHLPDGTPFDQASYQLPSQADADAATERAEAALQAADHANLIASRYVLSTVLYASVLFLAGIASKLAHQGLAHGVVTLAGVALIGALGVMFSLPVYIGIR